MTPHAFRKALLLRCTGGVVAVAALLALSPHRSVSVAESNLHTSAPCMVASSPKAASSAGAQTPPVSAAVVPERAPRKTSGGVTPAAPSTSAAPAGMVIAIDPETGALGPPTPEQLKEIQTHRAETFRLSPDGFVEIHRPDGAVGLALGERGQSYSMVRMTPDGRRAVGCVSAIADSAALPSGPPQGEER